MAASARLQARDAQLLKNELNCNMVRCSHYPPSPHFLDACDQLGLMVWEEPPGWDYVGDENFQAIFLQNVRDMVLRDRNRPSVIVWATRLNETQSFPTLYAEARQLAETLDGTRQTTGAMTTQSTTGWAEDMFAYNDYGSTGRLGERQRRPLAAGSGVPYIVSEAVGALTGPPNYRWIDPSSTLQAQAKLHAQANQQARANPAYAGVLGWAGVDYASLVGGNRVWHNLRSPGVLDTFRVPKPGAAFYRSQASPLVAPDDPARLLLGLRPEFPARRPGPQLDPGDQLRPALHLRRRPADQRCRPTRPTSATCPTRRRWWTSRSTAAPARRPADRRVRRQGGWRRRCSCPPTRPGTGWSSPTTPRSSRTAGVTGSPSAPSMRTATTGPIGRRHDDVARTGPAELIEANPFPLAHSTAASAACSSAPAPNRRRVTVAATHPPRPAPRRF